MTQQNSLAVLTVTALIALAVYLVAPARDCVAPEGSSVAALFAPCLIR